MKHLRLKGVGLDHCPEGLGQLDKLEALDLSDNRIDALDPGTAKLFKLTRLDLRGNSIKVYEVLYSYIPLLVEVIRNARY